MNTQYNKNTKKKHLCPHCLKGFQSIDTLTKHIDHGCLAIEGQQIQMPKEGDKDRGGQVKVEITKDEDVEDEADRNSPDENGDMPMTPATTEAAADGGEEKRVAAHAFCAPTGKSKAAAEDIKSQKMPMHDFDSAVDELIKELEA